MNFRPLLQSLGLKTSAENILSSYYQLDKKTINELEPKGLEEILADEISSLGLTGVTEFDSVIEAAKAYFKEHK